MRSSSKASSPRDDHVIEATVPRVVSRRVPLPSARVT
jgi:hypothetical protein